MGASTEETAAVFAEGHAVAERIGDRPALTLLVALYSAVRNVVHEPPPRWSQQVLLPAPIRSRRRSKDAREGAPSGEVDNWRPLTQSDGKSALYTRASHQRLIPTP